MAHAQAENWPAVPSGSGRPCFHVWKLVQTMKAAGWVHKASSDGLTASILPGTDMWDGMPQHSTKITATYTQPGVGSTVSVTVSDTSWMTNGMILSMFDPFSHYGVYTVDSVTDGNHVVLTNTGSAGPPAVSNPGTGGMGNGSNVQLFSMTSGAWWLGQGPSTVKIPFTSAVIGTFIRGENITQATSNATGEVIGVVWDGVSSGYLVVMPRTGTFVTSQVITGGFSTATVTPVGTIITYVRQVVFWMDNVTEANYYRNGTFGHIYYQCVDEVAEAAELFGSAARLAVVTAGIAPGGASSGANSFPGVGGVGTGLGSFVVKGLAGSGGSNNGSAYWNSSSNYDWATNPSTNAQIMCANATPGADVSADGSFILAMGCNAINAGAHFGFAFQRCDNNEDGDVDPYVWFCVHGSTTPGSANVSRTSNNISWPLVEGFLFEGPGDASWCRIGADCCGLLGWRRRGMSGETLANFSGFNAAVLCVCNNNGASWYRLQTYNIADTDKVSASVVSTFVREPIWVVNARTSVKARKGTLRWLSVVSGNNGTDTYDGKKWIQLANATASISAMVGGPADGTTTPSST